MKAIKMRNYKSIIYLNLILLMISCGEKNLTKVVSEENPWDKMEIILAATKEPTFKNATFSVLDYGAKADGKTMNTEAFRLAIKACTENGGGKVIVPTGKFLSGPIHLDNNVNLHLEEGAEILFSTNPNDYYPLVHTSFEGMELMNYSPLIYAKNKKNIAITGKGTLNGQANNIYWWPWKGKTSEGDVYGYKPGDPSQLDSLNLPALMKMAEKDVPIEKRVFGNDKYLRPNFIEPFDCENVLIKDIKIINAPFWIIHPLKCTNVIVDGVTIDSHGPNNDGCDPEYSKNVIIQNCTFNTGDDFSITFQNCFWGAGCRERMPRARNAQLHILSCYYNTGISNSRALGLGGGANNTTCYVENTDFTNINNVFTNYPGDGGTVALSFTNCLSGANNIGTVTAPSYTATAIPVNEVQGLLTDATCGAGATLQVSAEGVISPNECESLNVIDYVNFDFIKVYPTIVKSNLTIELNIIHSESIQIQLFNSNGQKIKNEFKSIKPQENVTLDLDNLASGMYLVA